MKRIASILLIALTCTFAVMAGNNIKPFDKADGRVVNITVADFSKITANGYFYVKLVPNSQKAGKIEYKTLLSDDSPVTATVRNKELILNIDKKYSKNYRSAKITSYINVYLAGPLGSIKLNGSGDIDATSIGNFNEVLNVTLNGSGDIKFATISNVTNLVIDLNGSGDIDAKSIKCNNLTTTLNGSGDIDLTAVKAKNDITARLQGSGDIDIKSIDTECIAASLSGSGDIDLKGQSNSTKLQLQGSGDIDAKGLISQYTIVTLNGSGDISCTARKSLTAKSTGNSSGDISVYGGKPANTNISGKRKNIKFK